MSSQILKNAEALSPSYENHILLHREKTLSELLSYFNKQVNSFIFGPPGIGKTSLIMKAIKDSTGKAIYIDCSLYQTTNAILREVLSAISSPIISRSNYDLLKRLKEKTRDKKIIVCLDNFEHLEDVGCVNKLLSLNICTIIVSDKEESYMRLDPFARAAITNLLRIQEYTSEQAIAILSDRAKEALKEWSYTDNVLKKIVEESKGNLALAINILKTAALKAESSTKTKIEETDVPEIDCPESELNYDEKILLKILREWNSLPSARLFAFYRETAKYPKEERSYRNYMKTLCDKGFVRAVRDRSERIYELIQYGNNADSTN